ncbi:MAG: hypothetical protein R3D71_03890 [Rickettsiales bacterium]
MSDNWADKISKKLFIDDGRAKRDLTILAGMFSVGTESPKNNVEIQFSNMKNLISVINDRDIFRRLPLVNPDDMNYSLINEQLEAAPSALRIIAETINKDWDKLLDNIKNKAGEVGGKVPDFFHKSEDKSKLVSLLNGLADDIENRPNNYKVELGLMHSDLKDIMSRK